MNMIIELQYMRTGADLRIIFMLDSRTVHSLAYGHFADPKCIPLEKKNNAALFVHLLLYQTPNTAFLIFQVSSIFDNYRPPRPTCR
jgi:hypothetical protein